MPKKLVKTSNPRKLVIEWRYKIDLRFYHAMDQIGCDLLDKFPDWQRSNNSRLKLINKSSHRSFLLTPNRFHLQFYGAQSEAEYVQFASSIHCVSP